MAARGQGTTGRRRASGKLALAAVTPVGREAQEAWEAERLAPGASLAAQSRGRAEPEAECAWRTAFQRDRDRVLHSKAFRRLKGKTQVFLAPEGDHYRTRLTHVLEVAQISRTVARALRLNEDLVEAIALGHDLGHTPFGHAGEAVLDQLHPGGFAHNVHGVRVVEHLEPMNLSFEVRDGILHHTGLGVPATLEGQVVKICDRVAYLNHDIDDALRAGVLRDRDVPDFVFKRFGPSSGKRIGAMVSDLIQASAGAGLVDIRMSPEVLEDFLELRAFMFRKVYRGSKAKVEEAKVAGLMGRLYGWLQEHPEQLAVALGRLVRPGEEAQAAVDHLAGMTDRYALACYEKVFLPRPWALIDEAH